MDQVRFDGRGANVQRFTNLFVAVPFGHQTQHFDFTRAQILLGWRAHTGHQASCNVWRQYRFPCSRGANRPEQFFARGIFE